MQMLRQYPVLSVLLEKAPHYASLLLVMLCGFLMAKVVWTLFTEPRPALTETLPTVAADTASLPSDNVAQTIASQHLFGAYATTQATRPATPVQTSQLALKLKGVYALPGKKGYAVIEESGKKQAVYGVGKPIGQSGAVLEQVLPDQVLLRRNGVLEKLVMPRLEDSVASGAGAIPAAMPLDMPPPDMPPVPGDQPPPEPEAVADMPPSAENFTIPVETVHPSFQQPEQAEPVAEPASEPPVTGSSLGQFRQEALKNPTRLLEVASPQPYEKDGKFLGYQLSPGSNAALFNQLGLQQGDVVTAVNGTVLDSPATAAQALQGVASATQVNLNILRGDQEISLPVNLQ